MNSMLLHQQHTLGSSKHMSWCTVTSFGRGCNTKFNIWFPNVFLVSTTRVKLHSIHISPLQSHKFSWPRYSFFMESLIPLSQTRNTTFTSHFRLPDTKLHMSSFYHPPIEGPTTVVNKYWETYLRCFTSEEPHQWE